MERDCLCRPKGDFFTSWQAPVHKRVCLGGKELSLIALVGVVRENKNNLPSGSLCFLYVCLCMRLSICRPSKLSPLVWAGKDSVGSIK